MKKPKIIFSAILSLIGIISVYGQLEVHLIDNEGWAKGDYIEFGINEKGVYGANNLNKPPNFHENRDTSGLFGFIANPLRDNWIDYDGDFFTPGSPEEGFTIEINGQNYSNNNESLGGSSLFDIPGRVTSVNSISSDCFEDTAQISWEGNVDGINIKRYYSVTKEGLFIQMNTVLRNLSPTVKENVFFMHNVDPDNNVTLSNSHETDMFLVAQASSETDDISIVKASTDALMRPEDMDGSFINMYAKDSRARVSYGGFNNRVASNVWNGFGFTNNEGDSTLFIDEAISLAFNLGDINPNQAVTFTYYYILQDIDNTFTPLIVNAFKQDPTLCDGSDGKITFSGLTPGDNYTLDFNKNGTPVGSQDFLADDSGFIELENLNAGTYSNITISFSGCTTSIDSVFELIDPSPPNYTLSKQDFFVCDGSNGSITFSNLTASTEYEIEFTKDGVLVDSNNYTANNSGQVTITGLNQGNYTDFVVTQFNCVTTSTEVINITGPATPISYPIPDQTYCDEDYDFITSNIDLTELESFIIGPDNPDDFTITFFETQNDLDNNNSITVSSYNSPGEAQYQLFVQKNDISSNCNSFTTVNITINTPPVFELNEEIICVNADDTTNTAYPYPIISTNLDPTEHTFQWYLNDIVLAGETFSNLAARTFGEYKVSVTSLITGCEITKNVIITPSGPPQILEVNILSSPFSSNHSLEIIAQGHGNYQFSLDNGPFQEEPLFTMISPGYHLLSILDTNGCGTVTRDVIFVDYMKFFTPNNDGIKDHWQIIGIEHLINPEILIFDRFGKLLKQLNPNSEGWNGTYNGKKMPTSDYWFTIIFQDENLIKRQFSTHFTLKR